MEKLPPCIGVPSRTPVAVWNVRPVGSAPDSLNVTVPTPPYCVNVTVMGDPAGQLVVPGFVTVMVWQLMVRLYCAPTPWQPFASVAVTVIGNEPGTVAGPARRRAGVLRV